jgi:urease accessory protein
LWEGVDPHAAPSYASAVLSARELHPLEAAGWRGRLELRFERRAGRTVIAARKHHGPLLVQRAFYPEPDGTCHVYVIHPPGGVVGGDVLEVALEVPSGASALITTPAATKLYRSPGPTAILHNRLDVRAGGLLEWLPQETIAFGGSRAAVTTHVALEPGARFLGWEITCLGRPASGDAFESGRLDQRTELSVAGTPLLLDRLLTEGGGALQHGAWGWGGRSVYGCFLATGESVSLTSRLREAVRPESVRELFAVTTVAGVTVCRYLGESAAAARACLSRAWAVAREVLLEKPACAPRIWTT